MIHVLPGWTPPLAVTSHRLVTDASPQPQAVADWAFHTFNTDLAQLEADRDTAAGETTFLAACVYRLFGHRSLSVGDVIRVTNDENDHWLACEPSGWRPIATPSNMDDLPLIAQKIYEFLRVQQTRPQTTPGLFSRVQVADAANQAADEILDAGDEGLRDALNLMVNATITYVAGEADTLRDVVERNYDEDLETVLGWIDPAL